MRRRLGTGPSTPKSFPVSGGSPRLLPAERTGPGDPQEAAREGEAVSVQKGRRALGDGASGLWTSSDEVENAR